MSKKKDENVDQQSELNLTRRSVLGASAAIAGAGIIGSQLIDPVDYGPCQHRLQLLFL